MAGAIEAITANIGCTAQTLLTGVRHHERDTATRSADSPGTTCRIPSESQAKGNSHEQHAGLL